MMKSVFAIITLLFFYSCTSDNSKINYLNNFSLFIDEIELQKNSHEDINWDLKADSLEMFEERKSIFRLNSQEEQDIENLIKRYEELNGTTVEDEIVVNFYFENSLSMNGYLGGINFNKVMHRIYGNLNDYEVNSFFVNTKEYSQDNLLDKIDNSDIKVGDIGNSDHQFIFSNAIKNATSNNLSMVITDGIYSVKDGNIHVVSIDIENAFKNALNKNEIETVVLKLSSEFNGTYYSETCEPGKKAIKINQNRPYYLLLFGNSKTIDNALKNITITDELDGMEQQARFFLNRDLNFNYSVLTTGEELNGSFKASGRGSGIIHDIEDAKKAEERGSKNKSYLQFAVALDYSKIPLPQTYLNNNNNYIPNHDLGYKIMKIIAVDSLSKTSTTYKEIKYINDKDQTNFTHIMIVKADKNLHGDLHIALQKNLPQWISEIGNSNDCEILNDEIHTFAFDQLMIGISKAYQKITKESDYFNFIIKIKT